MVDNEGNIHGIGEGTATIIITSPDDPEVKKEIKNIKDVYKLPVVVAINKYTTDTNAEIETIKEEKFRRNRHKKIYQDYIEKSISKILLNKKHKRFLTLKTLEKDEKFKELENENLVNERSKLEEIYNLEIEQIIANQRYEYIVDIKSKCVTKNEQKETITDKLDNIFLNKYLAIPIFAIIMFLIYYLFYVFLESYV